MFLGRKTLSPARHHLTRSSIARARIKAPQKESLGLNLTLGLREKFCLIGRGNNINDDTSYETFIGHIWDYRRGHGIVRTKAW